MITINEFKEEFNGHSNRYSSYLVINTTAEKVVEFFNKYYPNACIGSGIEENGNVWFEACKESPDIIFEITKELNTRGYADTDWDVTYFVAAENGNDYEGYTAEWVEGTHYIRDDAEEDDEEAEYDAFVDITDPSGAVFQTGAGAVNREIERYYADIVNKHQKKKERNKYVVTIDSGYIRDAQVFISEKAEDDEGNEEDWHDFELSGFLGVYTWSKGDEEGLVSYVAQKHGLIPRTITVTEI